MTYFPEEVVEHILGFVTSHRDRNAASMVSRTWYRVERLSRRSVFVCNCYAVRPERVHARFPHLRSLSVKGKPCFGAFRYIPSGWGATAEPWVDVCAHACPGLEELRFKRMVITDECLKLLARSFPNFKSLVLVNCQGFSTDGLAAIATNCRIIKEMDLQECLVQNRGTHWLSCFPESSTSLESLNFTCLPGVVDAPALEKLVTRSPNLKSLRMNRAVPLNVLRRILSCKSKLVDLGTGSFAQGNNPGAHGRLSNAFQRCSLLESLSGFWDARGMLVPVIYSVCKNLTCLNLSHAPAVRSADLIEVIRPCRKLQNLCVLDSIGDEGLKVVAYCCKELQQLRVLLGHANFLPESVLTEEGLIALSLGCQKLNLVFYVCGRMTNAALSTVANNCPLLMSFSLFILKLRPADAMTRKPLDEGFGAIVQSCKHLRRLSMSGLLTDKVFLYIGMYAESLEMLSVAFAGDTDNGMIYVLNGCKNLKKLQIRECPFGDTALLAGMHKYEAMHSLWMSSCNITLGGCKSLAANMPNLNVEVMKEEDGMDEVDEDANSAKVEKLYVYRTLAGPRVDAPEFVSIL